MTVQVTVSVAIPLQAPELEVSTKLFAVSLSTTTTKLDCNCAFVQDDGVQVAPPGSEMVNVPVEGISLDILTTDSVMLCAILFFLYYLYRFIINIVFLYN